MKTYVIVTDEDSPILGKTCEANSLAEACELLNPNSDPRLTVIELALLRADLIKITEEPGFKIICKKCNSENCAVYNSLEMGTDETGMMGNAGISCKDCGQKLESY
jgi:hypothetical protein